MDLEFGTNRCKLLYIEWIHNKDLLYSTENYIQYPVITHNEKEFFKYFLRCHTHDIKEIMLKKLWKTGKVNKWHHASYAKKMYTPKNTREAPKQHYIFYKVIKFYGIFQKTR